MTAVRYLSMLYLRVEYFTTKMLYEVSRLRIKLRCSTSSQAGCVSRFTIIYCHTYVYVDTHLHKYAIPWILAFILAQLGLRYG